MRYFLILTLFVLGSSLVNINRCRKKVGVGIYFLELKMKPYSEDIEKKKRKLKSYGKLLNIKKERIINDPETKSALLQGTVDSTSDNFFEEIFEVISLITNINRDALQVIQFSIKEYIKFYLNEKIDNNYELTEQTRKIIIVVFRNIIIPVIIHDSFQVIIGIFKNLIIEIDN